MEMPSVAANDQQSKKLDAYGDELIARITPEEQILQISASRAIAEAAGRFNSLAKGSVLNQALTRGLEVLQAEASSGDTQRRLDAQGHLRELKEDLAIISGENTLAQDPTVRATDENSPLRQAQVRMMRRLKHVLGEGSSN